MAADQPELPATPNIPIRSSELPYRSWSRGERFGSDVLDLATRGGAKLVGLKLEVLPPGKQSCPFHWHQREEEHFFVLEGRCILRSGEQRYEMTAGDYVCFPPATRVGHCFENPFADPCKFLAIGTRDADEIAGYPDTGKLLIRSLHMLVPLPDHGMDYWEGERVEAPVPRASELAR
jgi:uncharacterized cupin superfamily protein